MKTRPGVDRLGKQLLQGIKSLAEYNMDAHVKQCTTCTKAGGNPRERCSVWFSMAVSHHQTKRKLAHYNVPETNGMDPLFGDDDL